MNSDTMNPAQQIGDEIELVETINAAETSVAEARWMLGSVLATCLIIGLLGVLSSLT